MSEREHEPPVSPGDVLSGKFEVERVLGMGGMGVVVAARHLQLGQRVALKFMLPEALANRDTTERFMREARAVARLRNEHITRVLDVGTLDDGAPYIVMELLEGQDVAALLENGPLSVGRAAAIVLQACAALAEAHAAGIVHRDLKPHNLFMTTDVEGKPLVKVLDFGISKDLGEANAGNALTRTTAILGSPHYMSPEQLKSSRDVDARADVWSLGVCLFELTTATVPFDAPSVAELCAIVLSDKPPSVTSLRDDLPPELDAIVARCLERDAKDRFQTVAELATALEPLAEPWARSSADRARNVMRRSQASLVETLAPSSAPAMSVPAVIGTDPTLAAGPTVATWDVAEEKPRPRRFPLAAIMAGVAVLGAAGAIAVARLGQPATAAAVTSEVNGAPAPRATASVAVRHAQAVPAPPPSAAPAASSVSGAPPPAPTAARSATAKPRVRPPATRATAHAPALPRASASAKGDDSLLEGRK